MSMYGEKGCVTKGRGGSLSCPERARLKSDLGRVQWLQEYSRRLLGHWLQWQTPLGVALAYAEQIERDLAAFYEDPLKRLFIETTYR
jgi:hypothetical protein